MFSVALNNNNNNNNNNDNNNNTVGRQDGDEMKMKCRDVGG